MTAFLKPIGGFILNKIGEQVWDFLDVKEIDQILENTFIEMSRQKRNYNIIFQNSIDPIRELFTDNDILQNIGKFLINEERIVNDDNIKLIESKIDKKQLKKQDIMDLLEDFQKSLMCNLYLNDQIVKNFLVTNAFYLSETQKQILERIAETIDILPEEDTEGYSDVGAIVQFRILLLNFEKFIEEIKKLTKVNAPSRFLTIKRISDNEYHATYQKKSSNTSISVADSPFKIVYPNITKTKIWFKKKYEGGVEIVEITVFCSNPNIVNKLAFIFSSCMPSNGTLQQGNFYSKMKKFTINDHSHFIYAIKFDPEIIQEIKDAGISKNIKILEETLYGDPGLPRLKEIHLVISKLRDSNNTSKIHFFKSKKDEKLIKDVLVTFELFSDGRLLAWFRKDQFNNENQKFNALYTWYLQNAEFNLINPRKRSIL